MPPPPPPPHGLCNWNPPLAASNLRGDWSCFGTRACCNQLGHGNSMPAKAMHLLLWSCKPPDSLGRRPKLVTKVQKPPVH